LSLLADTTTATFEIGVSHAGALFWPLLWAVLFGGLAAARLGRGRTATLSAGSPGAMLRSSMLDGALSGATTGLGLALLVVLFALFAAMFRIPQSAGPRTVFGLVLVAVLILPNLVGWAVLAGMGATLQVGMNLFGLGGSPTVGIFGAAGAGAAGVQVPAYWLLLMVIPAVATIRAGYIAARAAGGSGLAARAALGAGALLVVGCWVLAWISGGHVASTYGNATVAVSSVAATFLPLLWALVGSWIGALVSQARQQPSLPPAPDPGTPASGPDTPYYSAARVSCPSCGTANDRSSRYCEGCGVRLSTA
jgi:hypothetical protein